MKSYENSDLIPHHVVIHVLSLDCSKVYIAIDLINVHINIARGYAPKYRILWGHFSEPKIEPKSFWWGNRYFNRKIS